MLGYAFQGGGGYGDPLKRDPGAILADFANGHVTEKAAAYYYGVIVKNGSVDTGATARRRDEIRVERLGTTPTKSMAGGDMRADGGRLACSCGCDLGPWSGNWKAYALTKVVPPQVYGPHIRIHPDLELREHICKECGSLLEAEVVRKGEESLVTITLDA